MFQPDQQSSYFHLLHDQHRHYLSLLTESHRSLARQYETLAAIQLSLAQRHDTHMPRYHKKYLQWSRATTKKAIQSLEREQERLEWYLRQCGDLIASYERTVAAAPGRRTGHGTQVPYPVTPLSMPDMPWLPSTDDVEEQPKYWDLSMLRERGGSAASIPSADSGFYEASILSQPLTHACAGITPPTTTMSPISQPRNNSFPSENDTLENLGSMSSPAKAGAGRQRRYSENAIQSIERRFALPKTHIRVRSVEQIPAFDRVASVPGVF